MSALDRALDEFRRVHPRKIDLGLDRIERVLATLGNPQDRLPPSIHVAGTNGKGSTVALLRAMLEASGASVHVYTSPHLVRFNERIVLAGQEIDDDRLIDVLDRVRVANDGQPLSFFEATTAAAFLALAEAEADYAIIEVGLGGRFDATNVFTPRACAITPIDFDHAEFLGTELSGIAREKAGIMKPGAPIFVGPQREEARAVLDAQADAVLAPIRHWGTDFRAYGQHGRLVFESATELLDLPRPALAGDHQIANAGLAIAVARELGLAPKDIGDGLTTAIWPARMQPLRDGALVDPVIQKGAEVWLDGGHNIHAARALSAHMASLEARSPRPLVLVMGMLANKDAAGFLDHFQGLAAGIVALPIPDHASHAPDHLCQLAEQRGMLNDAAETLEEALRQAMELSADNPPRILICGSLYLSGDVLARNMA